MDRSRHQLTADDQPDVLRTGRSHQTPAGYAMTRWYTRLLALTLGLAACASDSHSDDGDTHRLAVADSSPGAIGSEADTVLSVQGALRKFRAGLQEPSDLTNAATSREELARRFMRALAARDTAILAGLHMTAAEFGWLYYPENPISRPPYSLPAGLAWFELQGNSETGLRRALREYGGRRLTYEGLECPNAAVRYGRNTLWNKCLVHVRDETGSRTRLHLIATIVERDGKFKIASAANDL